MNKPSHHVPQLVELGDRINQFIEVNNIALENGSLSHDEELTVSAQNSAFSAITVLIGQLHKKGRIWKGGYEDNVGVVYEDQIQQIIDRHNLKNGATN